MRVPPPLNGPAPKLQLTYSAQSVDGRTAATNNQGSVVGEGFDLASSYIERGYVSCSDDGQAGKYDQCWKSDNATLVMNGASNKLVQDSVTGLWRLQKDDGSRVRRYTGTSANNPDNNKETWEVTTTDGTKYYFGLSAIPGVTGSTESVWDVPVAGNNTGEPCFANGTALSGRFCTQAWRWNLDYVVDPHGNAMSYWYAAETNKYAKLGNTPVSYVRGGRLQRIDYGQRAAATDNSTPPMRVSLTYDVRCLAGATACATYSKTKWPDTPYDQICSGTEPCTGMSSPTFFVRNMLTNITTKTRVGTTYSSVDSWDLTYEFLDSGIAADGVLTAKTIVQKGLVGGTLTMDPTTFGYTQLDNRVDGIADGLSPLPRWRMRTVTSETGQVTTVNYSGAQCTPANKPAAADSNTMRCYPQKWTPPNTTSPRNDWFHKYVVTDITDSDTAGGGAPVTTFYDYSGGGAWAYNTDKLVDDKYRTWSIWRGYTTVTTRQGQLALTDAQSKNVTTYFRGMDGDKQSGTAPPRVEKVTDSTGAQVSDSRWLAGYAREAITYTSASGAEYSGVINDVTSDITAGTGDEAARYVHTTTVRSRSKLADGSWRRGQVDTEYSTTTGQITRVSDHGDLSVANDQTCSATEYADARPNTGVWFVGFVARKVSSRGLCGANALAPPEADVLSDERTYYDGGAFKAAPTRGLATKSERIKSYSAGAPQYQSVATKAYDGWGRPTAETVTRDGALTRTTTTAYTHSTSGTLAAVAETQDSSVGGKQFTTTTTIAPEWGVATKVVDPNNKITEATYDPHGRLTQVWRPNRSKAGGATPSVKYAYSVTATAAPWVKTSTLNTDGTGYVDSYEIYDSMLRARQTQRPSPAGGSTITAVSYDGRGLANQTAEDVYATPAPSGTLIQFSDGAVPTLTRSLYDGMARATELKLYSNNALRWTTSTTYPGAETTTLTPPNGAPPITTITDIRGRVVRQIERGTPDLVTDSTYDLAGRVTRIESPGGIWTSHYDLRGRKDATTDPDSGGATYTYYDNDQLKTSTDANNNQLLQTYDSLDRPIGLYEGAVIDPAKQLTGWTYDAPAKGYPATVTRYVGGTTGAAFKSTTTGYNDLYSATGTQFTITPGTQAALVAGLPTSYSRTFVHNVDQSLRVSYLPKVAVGANTPVLAEEPLTYTYNSLGQFKSAVGTTGVVRDTTYDALGRPLQYNLGMGAPTQWWLTNEFDTGTGRLTRQMAATSLSPTVISDHRYTYDDAGNVLKDANTGVAGGDIQCFSYDTHQRLKDAWTPGSGDCAPSPAQGALGGAAPYWQSWTYTTSGLRDTQATRTGSTSLTDTYTYGLTGHANAVAQVSRGDGAGSTAYAFGYDASGNTTSRPDRYTGTNSAQTLAWDSEGNLSSVTRPGTNGTTRYIYGADGTLLLRDGPGTKTMYLGDTEVTFTKANSTLSAKRFYSTPAGMVAVRSSGTQIDFLVPDAHATASVSLDGTTHAKTYRYLTPFGEARGATPLTWPSEHSFLDKTLDADTGLASVGARDYDATLGRFLSVDPILDTGSPAQMLGYSYGNNNPNTFSDPSGLLIASDHTTGGGSSSSSSSTTTSTATCCAASLAAQPVPWTAYVAPPATTASESSSSDNHSRFSLGAMWSAAKNTVASGASAAGDALEAGVDVAADAGNWVVDHRHDIAGAVSYVPGPIGQAASGIDAAMYLGEGNYKAAAIAAAGLIPGGKILGKLGKGADTSSVLKGLAGTAEDAVLNGGKTLTKGPVFGTLVHTEFEKQVNALGRSDLYTEVSYKLGQLVDRGTKGSVRLDVVHGTKEAPTAVFDLKTGSASLTSSRIAQIQAHLPGGGAGVPIQEIRRR